MHAILPFATMFSKKTLLQGPQAASVFGNGLNIICTKGHYKKRKGKGLGEITLNIG